MNRRAFTLVELLIVIAIIGILISLSVYSWASVAARGRDATRKSDLARIKQALQQHYSDTRTYPVFDQSQLIYGAGWQLTTATTCLHANTTARLTTKYITEIPRDPKDGTDYNQACGNGLLDNQSNRYLYLTPTTVTGPITNPTSFALMTTLEQNANEFLPTNQNPFLNSGTTMGPWYSNQNAVQHGVNANYLVDSKNQ